MQASIETSTALLGIPITIFETDVFAVCSHGNELIVSVKSEHEMERALYAAEELQKEVQG